MQHCRRQLDDDNQNGEVTYCQIQSSYQVVQRKAHLGRFATTGLGERIYHCYQCTVCVDAWLELFYCHCISHLIGGEIE